VSDKLEFMWLLQSLQPQQAALYSPNTLLKISVTLNNGDTL
jgi:hypothetical protein